MALATLPMNDVIAFAPYLITKIDPQFTQRSVLAKNKYLFNVHKHQFSVRYSIKQRSSKVSG